MDHWPKSADQESTGCGTYQPTLPPEHVYLLGEPSTVVLGTHTEVLVSVLDAGTTGPNEERTVLALLRVAVFTDFPTFRLADDLCERGRKYDMGSAFRGSRRRTDVCLGRVGRSTL